MATTADSETSSSKTTNINVVLHIDSSIIKEAPSEDGSFNSFEQVFHKLKSEDTPDHHPVTKHDCCAAKIEQALYPKLSKAGQLARWKKNGVRKDAPIHLLEALEHLPSRIATEAKIFQDENVGAPWKIPKTLPHADEINAILSKSLAIQMTSLGEYGLDDCTLSGESMVVSGLVHFFLNGFGFRSEVCNGILQVGESKLPMAWLNIHGSLIDNTNHFWPRRGGDKPDMFDKTLLRLKRVELYSEEDPTATTSLSLISELGSKTCVTDPRLIKAYGNSQSIGKYIWFRSNAPAYPYPSFFFYRETLKSVQEGLDPMLRFEAVYLMKQRKLANKDIPAAWEFQCWHCKFMSKSLMTCNRCKVAKYCNADCQRADWLLHKLLHEDWRANLSFQRKRQSERKEKR